MKIDKTTGLFLILTAMLFLFRFPAGKRQQAIHS